MTIFGAIGIASTGLTVHRKWLDAVSDNLSNLNTVRGTDEAAFQAKYVVAEAAEYGNTGDGAGARRGRALKCGAPGSTALAAAGEAGRSAGARSSARG